MSALRLGRNPDGTRQVVVLEPAVGRVTHTRGSIPVGPIVVTSPPPKRTEEQKVARQKAKA